MSMKILSITLLLLSVHLCCHASPAHRRPSKGRLCCVEVTTLNMRAEVLGETYREQAAGHPCVKAIIFNTDEGKLCAQWVKDLVTYMSKA